MSAYPAHRPSDANPDTAEMDRRSAQRVRILQRCLVRPADARGSVSWKGIAYDLSARGIGLALPYPLSIGTPLLIEPVGLSAARPLAARVIRFHPVSYLWFCGCELDESLHGDALQAWLQVPAQLPQSPPAVPDPAPR
jgi:hypothetical protein